MNCATHAETAAVAFCRNCGRSICEACRHEWQGVPHCTECAEKLLPAAPLATATALPLEPAVSQASGESQTFGSPAPLNVAPTNVAAPNAAAANASPRSSSWGQASAPHTGSWDAPSPALAFLAGLIPGVGAVYNGQYAKGVVHALVWGGLLSTAIATERTGPPGSVAVFIILLVMTTLYMPIEAMHTARAIRRGEAVDEFWGLFGLGRGAGSSPVGGVLLILMGVVFLLHSLGYWRLGDAARFWPVTLIALGVHLLYRRIKEQSASAAAEPGESSRRGGLPSIRVSDPVPSQSRSAADADPVAMYQKDPQATEASGAAAE